MHVSPTTEKWTTVLKAERPPFFVLLTALFLYVLRFGYNYGFSDQDDFIPYLLHRIDPAILGQDWFVLGQASSFSIRTYFVSMLYGFAQFVPVWVVVLTFYLAAWLLIAFAVYRLGMAISRNRLAASASVIVALVLTPQWTLGGNDLVHSMLVPSMWGWALGLWGLVFFFHNKISLTALLLGMATWMQVLVGLQIAGLLGLLLLARYRRKQVSFRTLALFVGLLVLTALPTLIPLIYQQASTSSASHDAPSLFYVQAQLRVPHHYLLYSFPTRSFLRFGALGLLGGLGAFFMAHRATLAHRDTVLGLLLGVAFLCLAGFLGTEVMPSLFVAQLQLFKATVLAKLLFVILFCGGLVIWLPAPFASIVEQLLDLKRVGLGAALALWALFVGGIVLDVDAVKQKAGPLAHKGTSLDHVETWARTSSPQDAIFAVPPSWSGFRSRAQRAIVVNFKAFPYRDGLNEVWFKRLSQLAPLPLPERGSPSLQRALDTAYFDLSAQALLRLARRYAIDYVVRPTTMPLTTAAFEDVYEAGDWIIYSVLPTDEPAE